MLRDIVFKKVLIVVELKSLLIVNIKKKFWILLGNEISVVGIMVKNNIFEFKFWIRWLRDKNVIFLEKMLIIEFVKKIKMNVKYVLCMLYFFVSIGLIGILSLNVKLEIIDGNSKFCVFVLNWFWINIWLIV